MSKKKAFEKRHRNIIIAILIIAISIIGIAKWGVLGRGIDALFRFTFGEWPWLYQTVLLLISLLYIFKPDKLKLSKKEIIASALIFVAFMLTMSLSARFQGEGTAAFKEWQAISGRIFVDP